MFQRRCSFILLVALVSLLSFGSPASAADVTHKVAFLPGAMSNPSQAFAAKMYQQYGPDYGFEVTILDGEGDAAIQAQTVTNAIAQGMDAIFINPNDINAIIPALMEASSAGVVVGMFSSDLPESAREVRDFFVGVNDNMAGEAAAQAFFNAFPDGVSVVEVGGQAGHDAQLKRHDGFNNFIKDSSVTVLDYQATQEWATDQAMAIMEDFIVKYGDEIQGVFCHWDGGATGIINALANAKMEGVFVVGVDGNSSGFDQVRAGTQSVTIMQNFEAMAKKAMALAQAKLNGEEIEAVNFMPLDIVTLDNIDDFTSPEW